MKMKTAMVLAAVSMPVSGCADYNSQAYPPGTQGVSAQDRAYLIHGWHYEQDGIGWFTDSEGRLNIDPHCKWERVTNGQ
jgi:hypothetical protein